LASLREVAEHTGLKIVASGGISSMDSIEQLKNLAPNGLIMLSVGKLFTKVK
tara:strand:- start:155 stop:310 length:156 start_codon:yes stop_codon:yes gene_type:complete